MSRTAAARAAIRFYLGVPVALISGWPYLAAWCTAVAITCTAIAYRPDRQES